MTRRLVALPAAALALAFAIVPALAAPFPDVIELPNGWRPEGITAGRGTTAYVGSLATGAIARVDLRTGAVDAGFAAGVGRSTVGIDYDQRNDWLWAAGGAPIGGTSQVRLYDASSGDLIQTYTFTSGFLNDVAVTKDAVYVTDSNIQQLIVIPLGRRGEVPDPADAFTLPITGDFQYVQGFNANGIVAYGKWLLVPQSATGKLFAIDPTSGDSVELLPAGSITFADGLELRGSTLYVVRNQLDRVDRYGIRGADVRFLGQVDTSGLPLDVPTTVAFAAGRLWAVNARFDTPPTPDTEYWITQLPTK